jgi:hypothetical protein
MRVAHFVFLVAIGASFTTLRTSPSSRPGPRIPSDNADIGIKDLGYTSHASLVEVIFEFLNYTSHLLFATKSIVPHKSGGKITSNARLLVPH